MPSNKVWVKMPPKPAKLGSREKAIILEDVNDFITNSQKLSKRINRIKVQGGRIYFYFLYKPMLWNDPNAIFIKPLIDGKYNESIFARITLYDKKGMDCTADWQRHTGQWITLTKGTLKECLYYIDEDNGFFNVDSYEYP
jgi:hypothetical protein